MNTLCRILLLAACLLPVSALPAQTVKRLSLGEQPIFKVSKATEEIVVDGKMDEKIWQKP